MKRGMTIEYLKCRAALNFEVDFRVNGAIGTIVTKYVGSYFFSDNGSFSSKIYRLKKMRIICLYTVMFGESGHTGDSMSLYY